MKKAMYLLLPGICLLNGFRVFAQTNGDTIRISPVEISASRTFSFMTGIHITKIDSGIIGINREETLATLCANHSTVAVKDYGPGEIATASFRGTGASHTGVLWNGLLVNSPSLGLCDLSLVPANLADQISIYHGGSSAVNGTASLGGLISLDFNPDFTGSTVAGVTGIYTDAGNYYTALQSRTGNARLSSRSQLFYQQNKNQFHFINKAKKGFPEETLQHAEVVNYGFTQQLGYKLSTNSMLEGGLWYQVTGREQAPPMTTSVGEAYLKDSIFRTFLSYAVQMNRVALSVKGAYFDEFQEYSDTRSGIHSAYKVKSYKGEADAKVFLLNNLEADAGCSFNSYQADISEYGEKKRDDRFSLFGGLNYSPWPSLQCRLNVRKEATKDVAAPLVPSAGISYSGIRHLVLRANAGKQYNLPSLNEKYWKPGGNAGLQPESGWGGDAGLSYKPFKKELLEISVTAYAMLVNNWIQWYPIDSTGIYKATNLNKVYARGLESSLSSRFNIQNISCTLTAGFAYTKSTNEDVSDVQGEAVEGKQLIYVPLCNGNAMASMAYRGFELSYFQTFTGLRYIQTDNEDLLPAYTVAGISAGKTIYMKSFSLHLFMKINNLWNEEYQQIPWHASPLRSFTAGFQFNFTHLKKI